MKKIILKFISMFLALVVLASCLVIQVSAESTAEVLNEPLLKSLPEMPVKYLSNFFEDDMLRYDKFVIYRYFYNNKTSYVIYSIGDTKSGSDISYISLGTSSSSFYDDTMKSLSFHCVLATYIQETDSYSSSAYISSYMSGISLNCNYYTVNGADLAVETAVKNIVYSDFVIKYGGLTVFDPAKDNKPIVIPGLLDKSGSSTGPQPIDPQPGDYDFVGPLPLIPIEGDPSFQGFKDWLIKNEKYKDLAKYGFNCTADNISAVVDLWTGNYNSITSFFTGLKSMWSTINAVSQAKNIYNWFDYQFELYKKSLITYETIPIKDKDKVFNYDTDYDEDGNFVSSETAYLKLILGVLTAFKNDVNNLSSTIISYISSISINVNRLCNAVSTLPQVTADSIYNNLVNPFNLILDAINNNDNNVSLPDSPLNDIFDDFYNKLLSVFIPDSEYMTSWNTDVKNLINSKFGFISQLAELKQVINTYCFRNDEIVSYASDGQLELEEYMNYPSFKIPAFDAGIIKLDKAITIIDWSIIDEYRIYLHRIIIAVFYVVFISKRFKRTPNMIANNDIAD